MTPIQPVSAAPMPAEVHKAGPKAQQAYKSAQAFEGMLVSQLSKALTAGTSLDEGPYAGTIATALSDGVQADGGLGLSDALYRSFLGPGEDAKP